MCHFILMNFKHANIYLFKCYIRPILEEVFVVWLRHHVYLINFVENVQYNIT